MSSPLDWQYPTSGPVPPSPFVVSTVPGSYFVGRPSPPPTPPGPLVTPAVTGSTPCPPTPTCVPSSAEQDQLEWSNAPIPVASQSTWCSHRSFSKLNHWTSFADPLKAKTAQASFGSPNVSDCILYAHGTYARPSPVLIMMARAALDWNGLRTQPINPWACNPPLKLFSITGGRTPKTGLPELDQQSFEYYAKRPYPSFFRQPDCFLSYRYSISSIKALQDSLRTKWTSVYPAPIPPVIIRSRDLIGAYSLSQRLDGCAFVVPTEDSLWGAIRQRGVDLDFRPIDPSLTVETCMLRKGGAVYHPQHIVASKFAVNVFLEVVDSADRPVPLCEYLGVYVLRWVEGLTIDRFVWADIDPEVQRDVFDRAPDCFQIYKHPSLGWPLLPFIWFSYYKWDRHIVGLADEIEQSHSSNAWWYYMDSDEDKDTAFFPSAESPEQIYESFFDLQSA